MSLSRRRLFALFALSLCVAPAAFAAAEEQYVVELRVIEGEKGSGGPVVDKRLSALRKDLVNLPFRNFTLKDSHTSLVKSGERVSLEIPGDPKAKGKGRFLVVAAHGRQPGGKLRFTLTIDAVKFDTVVSVPDGGTIIVGGPRGSSGKALLFAFTAKAKK
jgi:hypothetical protein